MFNVSNSNMQDKLRTALSTRDCSSEFGECAIVADTEKEYVKQYKTTRERKLAFFILGLLSICGLRSFLVGKMAFCPPKLIGYEVQDNKFIYVNPFSDFDMNALLEQNNIGVDYKTITDGSNEVASLMIYKKPLDLNKQTILFSHGNNTDMGYMFPSYLNIVFQSDVNVVAYDYSGYGHSNKTPSETNIYKNIKMVYDYITKEKKINPLNIILYGYSIGTCSSSYLMSLKNIKVGGCILHSPLASGIKLLFPFQKKNLPWLDVFKNSERLKKVSLLPVYIMHGKRDKDIPYYHSVILLDTLKKNFLKQKKRKKTSSNCRADDIDELSLIKFWGVENSDHHDIEIRNATDFYRNLRDFLMLCKRYNQTRSLTQQAI
ncbi:alpha/beta hydrolase fold domain containing protein [Plasmodium brasilianum]|uniref:Alpha/beta hydrolase fold domain containing protein, putative n=2 Tax=Plasmodium (Plasmodium) TaxID=418103 RepID=A0A1D3PBN6_PLAMA|nr:alpha/beta hydrolase fold domain containing protein, putative [Plasmodium malariae]KAI4838327.1 alpha/beta hydrolase fold domain containing protein [Plasmodium brasilianum]SCN12723.1 alpha/beta hydrolase fold domain containing protein, putative [Plasmodium malariae]